MRGMYAAAADGGEAGVYCVVQQHQHANGTLFSVSGRFILSDVAGRQLAVNDQPTQEPFVV